VLLNLYVACTGAYGLSMSGGLLLRTLVGERWIVVAFFNGVLHLLLLPAVVLLPVSLLLRRWLAAALLVPAFVTFAAHYAPFFLPQTVDAPPDATHVSLLTYNLHAERSVLKPMADLIRAANADIVALQELTEEAAAYFARELADRYPYRALHPFPNWYYGRGVLSRYPITDDQSWPETAPVTVRLQRAVLDVDGVSLILYNFHAPPSRPVWGEGYDFGVRYRQIADLLRLAGQDDGAVALLGDFNTHDFDEDHGRITSQFEDAYRAVGWGMGFTNPDWRWDQSREGPGFIPLHDRLDYIFHNRALVAVEARVWHTSGGSDHRPLFARLALIPQR